MGVLVESSYLAHTIWPTCVRLAGRRVRDICFSGKRHKEPNEIGSRDYLENTLTFDNE